MPSLPAGGTGVEKAAGAYRTIGEVSRETGLPQHILRYWETRFAELRPLQRAGRRRYYRPEDVALVRRIAAMLAHDGYTISGVQKQLTAERKRPGRLNAAATDAVPPLDLIAAVRAARDALALALSDDA